MVQGARRLLHWLRRQDEHSPWIADLCIALVVMVMSMLPLLGLGGTNCDCSDVPAWAFLAVIGETLPLCVRRLWPFVSGTTVGVFTIAYGLAEVPDPPVPYGALVAVYSVAAYASPALSYVTAALAAASVIFVPTFSAGDTDVLDYGNNAVVVSGAWLLGDRNRHRAASQRASEERTMRLAEDMRWREQQAAAVERSRIARDMHDVLAHSVTLILVQAEAGPVVVARHPERATELFEEIARLGREALQDLRSLLGVLRSGSGSSDEIGARREPQPSLAAVPELVGEARAAGLDVELIVEGVPPSVSAGTALTAYRVIQEGLTNALRHGPRTPVTIRLSYGGNGLTLLVVNATRGGDGEDSTATTVATGVNGGYGLTGLRERVEAGGGNLSVGPDGSGGWILQAWMPLEPAAERDR
jgi:signal transduction histidine kinase